MEGFLGAGPPPTSFLPMWRPPPCVCPFCPAALTPSPPCPRRGWGQGLGRRWREAVAFCCQALPQLPNLDAPSSSHRPPLFLLQMVPHPEEVPVALGPDLLTVRKSGVSRTHSLPNDSYMCRDGSAAEGSLGHRSWGLPKAQSGTGTVGRSAGLTPGTPSLTWREMRQQKRLSLTSEEPPA